MTNLVSSTPANFGQQITTAAATAYAGVKLPIGWATGVRPNAPLVVTVQTGAGSLTGAGSTVATGSLPVSALDAADYVDFVIPFAAVYTNVLNVQAFVRLSCAGSIGWKVAVLDTRSNTVTTTTAAEVQGASQGGTTDSFFTGGTEDDRYDIPVAFIASPAAPTGFTATPVVGR